MLAVLVWAWIAGVDADVSDIVMVDVVDVDDVVGLRMHLYMNASTYLTFHMCRFEMQTTLQQAAQFECFVCYFF